MTQLPPPVPSHLGPCRPDPTTGFCAFPWHVHPIADPAAAPIDTSRPEDTTADPADPGQNMANPRAVPGVTAPNIEHLLGVDGLRDWWIGVATRDIDGSIDKITEYGGSGSAQDLLEVGHLLAKVAGRTVDDEEATELGIFFYIRSKIARWGAAIIDGRRPSDDTLLDLVYYGMMARRTRFVGGWPVANRPQTLADMENQTAPTSGGTTWPVPPPAGPPPLEELLYSAWHDHLAATHTNIDPTPQPFEFTPEHDGTLPLETAVYQALGAASTCWDNLSESGVFHSDRAKQIGEKLLRQIRAATGGGQAVEFTIDPTAEPTKCPIHQPKPDGGYTQTGWACTTSGCPAPKMTVPLEDLRDTAVDPFAQTLHQQRGSH